MSSGSECSSSEQHHSQEHVVDQQTRLSLDKNVDAGRCKQLVNGDIQAMTNMSHMSSTIEATYLTWRRNRIHVFSKFLQFIALCETALLFSYNHSSKYCISVISYCPRALY